MPSVPTAVTMPQPAAAPVAHHPPALDPSTLPGGHGMRTESPAVATSANAAVAPSPGQYHHPSSYQPLYAPYASAHTASYTSSIPVTTSVLPPPSVGGAGAATPAAATVVTAAVVQQQLPQQQQPQPPVAASHRESRENSQQTRPISPRAVSHSPNRERETYRYRDGASC